MRGIRLCFAICVTACFSTANSNAGSEEKTTIGVRPNIVLIVADDLGYGDVSRLNPHRGRIPTPHIDRLATQAVEFLDAHSASSVCTPTRYGILTGRYPWRTRLQKGVISGYNDDPLIADEILTLPEMLKSLGYATAALGKWHLGFQSDREPLPYAPDETDPELPRSAGLPVGARIFGGPIEHGFDYFWGCSNSRTMSSVIENDRVVQKLAPVEMMPELTARAVDFIRKNADDEGAPFFLYYAMTAPHLPIVPADEWQGGSPIGGYGDFVMQLDDHVGAVLGALEEKGVEGDTLVIFTSDNGCPERSGTAAMEEYEHFPSGQFRGYKTDIWEGGHRMPLIVRWPGVFRSGASSHEIVTLNDLMATIAEAVDFELPADAAPDSTSFLYELLSGSPSLPRPAVVHQSNEGQFAIRDGRWKLIFGAGSGGFGRPTDREALEVGLPEAQLYDMYADPGETVNLIDRFPDIARELAGTMRSFVEKGRSTAGPALENDVSVELNVPAFLGAQPASGQ